MMMAQSNQDAETAGAMPVGVTVSSTANEAEMSPLDVLIRLYEGAIDFLTKANHACQEGEVESFKSYLSRGRRIIEEFQRTLDYKSGGQITAQLNDLYNFMLGSLTQAELTHDAQFVQRVVDQLQTLLDGWQGARNQNQLR